MAKTHIILVHGAYHQPWHMHLLTQTLEAVGYKVSTPHLLSAAVDPPTTGALAGDVETIKSALETAAADSDAIVPFYHSYAGVPGSEALAEISPETREKITRVVYLAAFIIDQGMAVTTPSGGMTAPWSVREGDTVYVPDPTPVFYHDVEPALAEQAVKHLVRQSYETLATTKKHVGWNLCPSTYIFCTEDRGLPVKRIEESLPRLLEKYDVESQWEILFLHSAHSPFLNMPEAVAKLIRKAAGEQV